MSQQENRASAEALQDQLVRWVADDLITQEQASRIAATENVLLPQATDEFRPGRRAPDDAGFLAPGRGGYAVEALGYVGSVLAVIAGFIAVGQLWPDIPVSAEIAFAAAGALALLLAGALVRPGTDPALRRLRAVLWALSAACVAALAGLLADQVWKISGTAAAALCSSVTAAYSAGLWWRFRTPVQHAVTFVAAAVTAGAGIDLLDPGPSAWSGGLAVWLLSVGWAVLSYRGVLTPVLAGEFMASIGMIVGAQLTMGRPLGDLLAVITIGALLLAGVMLRWLWTLAVGAAGVLLVIPQIATRYLPESIAAPLAVLIVGLILVALSVWLARRRPAAE